MQEIENISRKRKPKKSATAEKYAEEWVKCQSNPFYFIYNYVYIPETGGRVKLTKDNLHYKMKRVVRVIYNYHHGILMASRQLGKALDVNTPILMADGNYKRMLNVFTNDYVVGPDFKPNRVCATTEIMYRTECYRLDFNNGDNIVADKNHLWKVSDTSFRINNKILTTEQLYLNKDCFNFFIKENDELFTIKNIEIVPPRPVKCIQVERSDGMYLCGTSNIPTHNSTIAACLLSWASVFFPRNRSVILNFRKDPALENLGKIKFIIENLPSWMVTEKPFKQKGDIKTYIDLFNDSKVQVFYPSTVHGSDTLARSLTSPILYIDESAHIKDMEDIYGSAQPILSKAREQAARNNYPYFTLVTSTPNGTQGRGLWFYDRWKNAVESDELFEKINDNEEKWKQDIDINAAVQDPNKNTFLRIQYHWSEDPTKDEKWYKEQCQDLANKRRINQELDLVFVGTQDCIFDDELLSEFAPISPVKRIRTPHAAILEVFDEQPSSNDYYLIGCDTAQSLNGAFCAIEVFSFRDFNQVAELSARFGSYTAFAETIDFVFKWLRGLVGENIILCIENNTIGRFH